MQQLIDNYPETLYKFRHFQDPFHLKMLTDNEIYFAHPDQFNDPFDCNIRIPFEVGTEHEKKSYILNSLINHQIHILGIKTPPNDRFLNKSEKIKFMRKCLESLGMSRIKALEESNNVYTKAEIKTEELVKSKEYLTVKNPFRDSGVFSLSTSYDNQLLWSHYSFNHRGFCVGFHIRTLLIRLINSKTNTDMTPYFPFKVLYPKDVAFPIWNWWTAEAIESTPKLFATKSADWEYEQEYRIIAGNNPRLEIKVDASCFESVYLGCQIRDEDRNWIIETLKNRGDHLPLYQMVKSTTHFKLHPEPIDY